MPKENAMEGDREAHIAAGMDDVLAKPVELEARSRLVNNDRAVLNLESVRIAFEDDDEGLLELLDLITSTATADLERLQAAIAARDGPRAAALAHGLKGSTSNVGAQEFAAVSALLEGEIHSADWPAVLARFPELRRAFGHLLEAIHSFRASLV